MKKICLCLLACCLWFSTNNIYAAENASLMIVAHPDDETIWGANHLLKGNYTVLCITNGDNKNRKAEFEKAMIKTHSKGIILTYPDKTNGKRNQWKTCKKEIDSKDWNQIVTHNPNGEYGHIHHKMISQFVTKILQKEDKMNRLMYFGQYTSRKNKQELKKEKQMSKKEYKEKMQVIKVYTSQKKVMKHLHHMLPYENWIKAN